MSRMTLANVRVGKLRAPMRELVYGVPGAGKSTFAAGAPNPIFLGSEDGTKRLNVARLPQAETFADVLDGVALLAREDHKYETLAIDTVDWLEPLVHEAVRVKYEAATIEDVKGGFGKGYTLALDAWRELLTGLELLQKIKGMHVLLLGHAEVKTFKNPSGEDYDRYRLKLNEKAGNLLREWTESVLFASVSLNVVKKKQVGTPARYLYTTEAPGFDAKNRYGLPSRIPLSFSEFWKHWESGLPADAGIKAEILEGLAQLAKANLSHEHALAKAKLTEAGSDSTKLRLLSNWIRAKVESHEEGLADRMGVGAGSHDLAPDEPPPIASNTVSVSGSVGPTWNTARESSSSSTAPADATRTSTPACAKGSTAAAEPHKSPETAAPQAPTPIGQGEKKAGAEVAPQEQRPADAPPARDPAPAPAEKKQEGLSPSAVAAPGSQKLASSPATATEASQGGSSIPPPAGGPPPASSPTTSSSVPPAVSSKGVPEPTPPFGTKIAGTEVEKLVHEDKLFGIVFEDPGLEVSGYVERLLPPGVPACQTPVYADALTAIVGAESEINKEDAKLVLDLAKETHGKPLVAETFARVTGRKITKGVPSVHPIVFRCFLAALPSRVKKAEASAAITESMTSVIGPSDQEIPW